MSTKKLYMTLSIVFLAIGIVAPSAMLVYNQNINSTGIDKITYAYQPTDQTYHQINQIM